MPVIDERGPKVTRSERHLQTLVEAFRGLASEYTWRPDDVREYPTPGDPGRCTCGHPIRIGYVWRHPDGHSVELGSDCTTQVPGLDERFAALVVADARERAKVEAAEARRRAREERDAPVIAECLALGVECAQLLDRVSALPAPCRALLGELTTMKAESILMRARHGAGNVEWFRAKALRCVQPTVRRTKLRRAAEEAREVGKFVEQYMAIICPQLP